MIDSAVGKTPVRLDVRANIPRAIEWHDQFVSQFLVLRVAVAVSEPIAMKGRKTRDDFPMLSAG